MVFIERFGNNRKEIFFIGTSHDKEISQINFIKEKIRLFNPEVILVEGGFENATFSNENESINRGWEMGFSSYFARINNISLLANDPNEKECINFLYKIYGKDFTFFYFVLRNLDLLLKKQMPLSAQEKINFVIEEFKRNSNWVGYKYTFSNFKDVFKKIIKENFDENKNYGNYFDSSLNLLETNYATKKLSEFRDVFMLGKIKECILNYDRVFIIKGSSHLTTCKNSLRNLFDES